MKTCPWCEGKKVTGQMVRGEDARAVNVLGKNVPVIGVVDRPCGICQGTGEVTDERYRELTAPTLTLQCVKCRGPRRQARLETYRGVTDYVCLDCGGVTCGGCMRPESACECKPDDCPCDPD